LGSKASSTIILICFRLIRYGCLFIGHGYHDDTVEIMFSFMFKLITLFIIIS